MLATFKRIFLLALLGLTGWAAVVIAVAVYWSGPTPAVDAWALKGVVGEGILLLGSFAAYMGLDRRASRWLAIVGLSAAALMLFLGPVFIWWQIVEPAGVGPGAVGRIATHRFVERLVETGVLTAGWLCVIPFALIPRMRRVGKIAQYTAVVYLSGAYAAVLLELWDLHNRRVEEGMVTLLIPAGACLMGVFVLHKFFEIRRPDPLTAVEQMVEMRCPRCRRMQMIGIGASRCEGCRLKVVIAVEEPKCPNCGFNLYGLTRALCPECGLGLDEEDVSVPPVRRMVA